MIRQSFGFNLSSDMTPSNGYKVSDPLALEKSWMHDAPRFCNMMGYVASGAAMAPGLMMVLPVVTPYLGNAAKLYHTTVGSNGGYLNMGLNWINQSYTTGNWGLENKSITGLIMAGSLRTNTTVWGQMAVGVADPWGNVTYKSTGGLQVGGFISGRQSLQKTTALSIMGAFGPLYQQVPLSKFWGANFMMEHVLMAPLQKAATNVEE